MFGQHAGNVGMVVLDANFPRDIHVEGVFCREVFGMQIVGDRFGVDIEEALEVLNALAEGGQRL